MDNPRYLNSRIIKTHLKIVARSDSLIQKLDNEVKDEKQEVQIQFLLVFLFRFVFFSTLQVSFQPD